MYASLSWLVYATPRLVVARPFTPSCRRLNRLQVLIAIGIRQPEKKSSRKETEELNVWKETTRRSNCVVMVRLKHKVSPHPKPTSTPEHELSPEPRSEPKPYPKIIYLPPDFRRQLCCSRLSYAVPVRLRSQGEGAASPHEFYQPTNPPTWQPANAFSPPDVCPHHLQCAVMVAHSALLFQHAQKWAGSDPLMIVGDFNTKPKDPCYSLMATGALDPLHPQHPPSPAPFDDPFDHVSAVTPVLDPARILRPKPKYPPLESVEGGHETNAERLC